MSPVDIVEVLGKAVERTILDEWKHEGYIDIMQSDHVDCVIDGKKYCISLCEIEDD